IRCLITPPPRTASNWPFSARSIASDNRSSPIFSFRANRSNHLVLKIFGLPRWRCTRFHSIVPSPIFQASEQRILPPVGNSHTGDHLQTQGLLEFCIAEAA